MYFDHSRRGNGLAPSTVLMFKIVSMFRLGPCVCTGMDVERRQEQHGFIPAVNHELRIGPGGNWAEPVQYVLMICVIYLLVHSISS